MGEAYAGRSTLESSPAQWWLIGGVLTPLPDATPPQRLIHNPQPQACQHLMQALRVQRLGQKPIHPALQAPLELTAQGIRGERDDRCASSARLEIADLA